MNFSPFTLNSLKLVPTLDGSYTLLDTALNQTYHSVNGALQEAEHVFLQNGLIRYLRLSEASTVNILEIGFGTGMNFLVTADYCQKHHIRLNYTGVEPFPVPEELILSGNYTELLTDPETREAYSAWYGKGKETLETGYLKLHLLTSRILDTQLPPDTDVVYFDAFSPDTQPGMWAPEVITRATSTLKPGGIFVSYSITGNLKRILRNLGFRIEKPKGAAGKREMIRATKQQQEEAAGDGGTKH